uniref:sn-1-specific diacylglycerol lipase ABHD11 n=1 Tax=Bracon brevicornis TaxID=1563983 RepID=A0A6V7JTC0_9HYME
MHGLFGSKNNWNSLSKAINQHTTRKIITIDARNHGESPHHPDMTYQAMAGDIKNLLNNSLMINEAVLMGHSMGGAAVMLTSLKYPEIVEKLIVVDMTPIRTSPSLQEMSGIMEAMKSVNFQDLETLSQARKKADIDLAKTIKSSTLRQFLITNVIESSPKNFQWRVNLPIIMNNFNGNIARFYNLIPTLDGKTFDKPTLFIAGGKSDYIRPKDHNDIRKLFTNAEFVYIPDAAHWLHAEKPAEFLKISTDFINN